MVAGDIGEDGGSDSVLFLFFDRLTAKQHEVFAFVAEGHTTKEIAWRLNITDSAVNQRIEAVRSRAGSPPRAELARAYRRYAACHAVSGRPMPVGVPDTGACDPDMDEIAGIGPVQRPGTAPERPANAGELVFRGVVPPALAGANAGLNRVAVMVMIALGLMMVAMVGLGVAQALTTLLSAS